MGTASTTSGIADVTPREQDAERVVRSFYDAFNSHQLDRAAALIADDGEWLDVPSGTVYRGPSGYLDFDRGFITPLPDARVEILNVVAAGDTVVTEFLGRGTHDGPFVGPNGATIAPTGNKVELAMIEIMQIRDGKISRARSYYDAMSLLRQLGAA